jgi:hypothetical protein
MNTAVVFDRVECERGSLLETDALQWQAHDAVRNPIPVADLELRIAELGIPPDAMQ